VIWLPHFSRSLLTRSLLIWLLLRAAVTAANLAVIAQLGLPSLSQPLLLTPQAVLLVIAFVAGAVWVSVRRRNEDLFLRCLGYGRLQLLAMLVAPPAVLEILIAAAAYA
jgi:hypothetical protein